MLAAWGPAWSLALVSNRKKLELCILLSLKVWYVCTNPRWILCIVSTSPIFCRSASCILQGSVGLIKQEEWNTLSHIHARTHFERGKITNVLFYHIWLNLPHISCWNRTDIYSALFMICFSQISFFTAQGWVPKRISLRGVPDQVIALGYFLLGDPLSSNHFLMHDFKCIAKSISSNTWRQTDLQQTDLVISFRRFWLRQAWDSEIFQGPLSCVILLKIRHWGKSLDRSLQHAYDNQYQQVTLPSNMANFAR